MPARILVISDLHAHVGEENDSAPSNLSFARVGGQGDTLLEDCIDTVENRFGDVEAVLVPGDLTDRANPDALSHVWQKLHEVATRLNAQLVATAGNHDYDSRDNPEANPKGSLQTLRPRFPVDDRAAQASFFAYNYCQTETSNFQFLVLNSSAHHGYTVDGKPEFEHGRIDSATLGELKSDLHPSDNLKKRLLVLHHHISQLPGLDHAEMSMLREGGELTDFLSEETPWMVIHGHKHRPYIQWAPGNSLSPLLFSAGSFSANMGGGPWGAQVRNQFHVIEFDDDVDDSLGVDLAGTVYSWSYAGVGWQPAPVEHVLPHESGFGFRGSVAVMAKQIRSQLAISHRLDTNDLQSLVPALRYVNAFDLNALKRILEAGTPRTSVSLSASGRIEEVELV
ncbi:metallophosphoesterase family protein [Curtobacterium poinsettiae]|uniref:metallophosphoesterase family protein n=1 Tax=Curtobacterium poinsettiae TaxID=159612 RepID=UPI00217CFE33|nr:metallophosphoesterase [Curtobacterium flaccumfaciens]MCS6578698.1 metallophosphoesterase [Curtobacterium flaccumfaciens]